MQMRFDGNRYRDCRWCGGRGCLACPAEADKDYQRLFGDAPKGGGVAEVFANLERAKADGHS